MSKEVPWTLGIYQEFAEKAMLSEFECKVLETRIKGWTIVKQSMEFGCSESVINQTIRNLKDKYDRVQPSSNILPRRKLSGKEKMMDESKKAEIIR